MTKRYVNAGKLLKEARAKCEFTQQELADKLGIHGQYVSNWERGQCLPGEFFLYTVLKTLKLSKYQIEEALVEDARAEVKEYLERIS